jgi:hypothetical protein
MMLGAEAGVAGRPRPLQKFALLALKLVNLNFQPF